MNDLNTTPIQPMSPASPPASYTPPSSSEWVEQNGAQSSFPMNNMNRSDALSIQQAIPAPPTSSNSPTHAISPAANAETYNALSASQYQHIPPVADWDQTIPFLGQQEFATPNDASSCPPLRPACPDSSTQKGKDAPDIPPSDLSLLQALISANTLPGSIPGPATIPTNQGTAAPIEVPEEIAEMESSSASSTATAIPDSSYCPDPNLCWLGYLLVQVTTGSGAIPVDDAHVTVTHREPDGTETLVAVRSTDRSGQTPLIPLPAPNPELSQEPENAIQPYSTYNLLVQAPGYYPVENIDIPVFANVKSIQPVQLIPLQKYEKYPDNTATYHQKRQD